MKPLLNVLSVILILAGGVFFLQGMRVLPSQVMYGKSEWVVIGAVVVILGAAMLVFVNRRGAHT